MYEKVEKCPICSNERLKNEMICKDYTVSKESFAIISCEHCQLWITSPRPTSDQIGKYYESPEYISHTNKSNSFVNIIYKIVRQYTLSRKVKIIKEYKPTGLILDYGCGTGAFLKRCKDEGFQIEGIEPNTHAREEATKITGQVILESIIQHEETNKADIITLWHVLEHVADLDSTIQELYKRLNKDGYIIIAVPNKNSYDAKHYKEMWAAYDVPRHLYHFTKTSISKLSKKYNLKLVQTIPQYFDSYYVSILSERNQGNKLSFIKGIIMGLKSNTNAFRNSNEYSSLIYILKKS